MSSAGFHTVSRFGTIFFLLLNRRISEKHQEPYFGGNPDNYILTESSKEQLCGYKVIRFLLTVCFFSVMATASIEKKPGNEALIATAEKLQALIESFIELGVLVHDNQGTQQSQTALIHKTNQMVSQLSSLTANTFTEQFPIPLDVLTYIEDGRNPDIYTREFVEVTAKTNARLKGRMLGFRKLRDVLGDKLTKEFPELQESIEEINQRTTP